MRWQDYHGSIALVLALAAALPACGNRVPQQGSPATTSAPPPTTTAPTPATTASAAPSASAAQPVAPAIHCKARGAGKLAEFVAPRGTYIAMVPRGGDLYYLAWKEGPAKAVLSKVPRDGSAPTELATQEGLGKPESFTLDAAAAYFTRRRSVIRMPIDGNGPASTLASDFSGAIALQGDDIYGVRCDPKDKTDKLVRVPRRGGEIATVATWPRTKPGDACEYKTIAVDAKEAFVGDWSTRRLLAVALVGGAMRELATGHAFLGRILPEPDRVTFQASDGLYRAPRTGGAAAKLADIASMPFGELTWDDSRFFVFQTMPYERAHSSYSLPREGGKPTQLDTFVAADVTEGPGILGIAVDDECMYYARTAKDVVMILAKQKP